MNSFEEIKDTGADTPTENIAPENELSENAPLVAENALQVDEDAHCDTQNEPETDIPHNEDVEFFEEPTSETPIWNKVNYTNAAPIKDYLPMSRGLRIFAGILAAVILLTAASVGGYFIGKNSVSIPKGESVKVDLAAKPKDTDMLTPAQVYNQVNESVVGIRVFNEKGQAGDASGVFYSKDGYIVTNDHIYSEIGAPKFRVYMHDGTEYNATYVAGDSISDLAVLKIEGTGNFKVAEFGDSRQLVCGESVVAVGRPNDATDNSSITSGIISLTRRRVKTTSSYSASLIQTDSAINPGSSGGALVNMYGEVSGITASKPVGVEYDAIGFAIPTVTVKRIVEQLISDRQVKDRAKLGITYTEVNSVTAEINGYDNTGLYIVSVSEESDIFGKVGEGDIITHVNGEKISTDDIVLDVIEDCRAGDTIALTVLFKNGTQSDFDVTLRANISESSYSEIITSNDKENSSSGQGGGTFDFPFGE